MTERQLTLRNFCIIAHIDHGKSTLADRFIQRAHIVDDREFHDQMLDTMDIERERGITIKSQTVNLPYEASDGTLYRFNLVDTPGHVDFSYEVSRAISACEGALLLVDATQGVEAQTLANMYMALEHNLEIIPVINKIDLPAADVEGVKEQIEHELGLPADEVVSISAKMGTGLDSLYEAIVGRIPPPSGDPKGPLKALVFDSHYDPYRGVVLYIRVFEGSVGRGDEMLLMSSGARYGVEEVGILRMRGLPVERLEAGDIGYLIAGVKTIRDVRVGDTITSAARPAAEAVPGFRAVKPVVYSSIFPVDSNDYEELGKALEKLVLNDASLVYEKTSSSALGFGYKCGFLGLLHLEVVQERLEREFGLSVVFTAPSVQYRVRLRNGEVVTIETPDEYPDPSRIEEVEEPYIKATIITPDEYVGPIMKLCMDKRGVQTSMIYLDSKRVELIYEMPLAEVLFDFYDKLKSISRGYASFDYEILGLRPTDVVKLDILVNGKPVDALSQLVFRGSAAVRARAICRKLKDEIPRHQFKIPIQGAVGSQIIARETIPALRKDVTAKCYGGDITRKRKLLERQKEGKKRMKMIGEVEVPQRAFLAALKAGEGEE
ncbi:GTP-binding protein lepA [Spirochaeta thermophila DSM 6578]|uniref:Elongation factor 4 n=1 Tax=Winmispira thermophila (strain ATCC 700085 / DSM 6578 / Z-1203) TaxID=869211 RepID=G0GEQ2_WINT7|nr:translation elongation factor 4 [Spirochaeta thermophila]AEJ61458.1 GTP-binding protein lepA [Spirochaeta thermophila DSM 6578]